MSIEQSRLPACPPWCSSPADHPYTDEAVDGSYVARYHEDAEGLGEVVLSPQSSSFSGLSEGHAVTVGISCEEQAVSDEGPAVCGPATITLWTENPVLTAQEARDVAQLLQRAAERLDAITGAATGDRPGRRVQTGRLAPDCSGPAAAKNESGFLRLVRDDDDRYDERPPAVDLLEQWRAHMTAYGCDTAQGTERPGTFA